MFEGSKGAIDLANDTMTLSNSKHIDVRYHFWRELVGKGDLSLKNVRTGDQHADVLTKAVAREHFGKHGDFFIGGMRGQS